MSIGSALLLSLVLLLLNAFFVAGEFAVVAAKRHRLEEHAAEGSRAARSAVAAHKEMSLMLAGAQLGITACTLGLGALAEPAVASLLTPLIELTGWSYHVSHVVAVVIAVAVVVFLHMVVGEMAPKSWTISHPEPSALLLAMPFRGFTWSVRPLLWVLNELANLFLRVFGVDPVDTVSSTRGPADLQLLVIQSREHGVLTEADHQMLSGALRLESETVASVAHPPAAAVTVPVTATVADVEDRCRDTGRSRLFVLDEQGETIGLVHVRDAVRASAAGRSHVRLDHAPELVQEAVTIPAGLPLIDAVTFMRQQRAQLALVTGPRDETVGITSLEDILEQILGEFEDETDRDAPGRPAQRRP